jgi:hypothetical protein
MVSRSENVEFLKRAIKATHVDPATLEVWKPELKHQPASVHAQRLYHFLRGEEGQLGLTLLSARGEWVLFYKEGLKDGGIKTAVDLGMSGFRLVEDGKTFPLSIEEALRYATSKHGMLAIEADAVLFIRINLVNFARRRLGYSEPPHRYLKGLGEVHVGTFSARPMFVYSEYDQRFVRT